MIFSNTFEIILNFIRISNYDSRYDKYIDRDREEGGNIWNDEVDLDDL